MNKTFNRIKIKCYKKNNTHCRGILVTNNHCSICGESILPTTPNPFLLGAIPSYKTKLQGLYSAFLSSYEKSTIAIALISVKFEYFTLLNNVKSKGFPLLYNAIITLIRICSIKRWVLLDVSLFVSI